jgi:hypothetical protein
MENTNQSSFRSVLRALVGVWAAFGWLLLLLVLMLAFFYISVAALMFGNASRAQPQGLRPPTATEVMRCLSLGLTVLKFFPAATSGGSAAVQALSGPFRQARFVPTGGIGPDDAGRYLALPNVIAVGGSWLVPPAGYADGEFDAIGRRAADALAISEGASR